MCCNVFFGVGLLRGTLPCRYGSGDGRLAPRPADGPFISAEITDSFQFMPAYVVAVSVSYITVKLLTPRAWNVETGHDDVLSLPRTLRHACAVARRASALSGMKGTGLDERIELEAGKEVSDADKSYRIETDSERCGRMRAPGAALSVAETVLPVPASTVACRVLPPGCRSSGAGSACEVGGRPSVSTPHTA